MMDCERFQNLLTERLDQHLGADQLLNDADQLRDAEAKPFEEHAKSCVACRQVQDDSLLLLAGIQAWKSARNSALPNVDLTDRILLKLDFETLPQLIEVDAGRLNRLPQKSAPLALTNSALTPPVLSPPILTAPILTPTVLNWSTLLAGLTSVAAIWLVFLSNLPIGNLRSGQQITVRQNSSQTDRVQPVSSQPLASKETIAETTAATVAANETDLRLVFASATTAYARIAHETQATAGDLRVLLPQDLDFVSNLDSTLLYPSSQEPGPHQRAPQVSADTNRLPEDVTQSPKQNATGQPLIKTTPSEASKSAPLNRSVKEAVEFFWKVVPGANQIQT